MPGALRPHPFAIVPAEPQGAPRLGGFNPPVWWESPPWPGALRLGLPRPPAVGPRVAVGGHTAWGVGAAARAAALLKTPPVGVEMAPLGRCC